MPTEMLGGLTGTGSAGSGTLTVLGPPLVGALGVPTDGGAGSEPPGVVTGRLGTVGAEPPPDERGRDGRDGVEPIAPPPAAIPLSTGPRAVTPVDDVWFPPPAEAGREGVTGAANVVGRPEVGSAHLGNISRSTPRLSSDAVHGGAVGATRGNAARPVLLRCMPASHVVLIVLAGVGAGIFNGVAGGGSLISFPILLGLGYPALTANITNTVGIWPGYLASAAGYRREIGDQAQRLARLTPIALAGGVAGALLLLTTSAATFDDVVPWLVLGAAALFALQPVLRRALDRGSSPPRTRPALLVLGVFGASVYGGYFGAAMGVMFLAVLGLALPVSLAHTSGLRAVLSMIVNGIAAVVFIVHGGLAWEAVGLLAAGSLVGGYVGARLALALPASALRVVVVVIGMGTAVKLLL